MERKDWPKQKEKLASGFFPESENLVEIFLSDRPGHFIVEWKQPPTKGEVDVLDEMMKSIVKNPKVEIKHEQDVNFITAEEVKSFQRPNREVN